MMNQFFIAFRLSCTSIITDLETVLYKTNTYTTCPVDNRHYIYISVHNIQFNSNTQNR